jgi:hypothetical protein
MGRGTEEPETESRQAPATPLKPMEPEDVILRRQLEPEPTANPDVDIFKFPLRYSSKVVEGIEYVKMVFVRFPIHRYGMVLN